MKTLWMDLNFEPLFQSWSEFYIENFTKYKENIYYTSKISIPPKSQKRDRNLIPSKVVELYTQLFTVSSTTTLTFSNFPPFISRL